eukprot:1161898-Pelagomonas_calceolata.AAC.6
MHASAQVHADQVCWSVNHACFRAGSHRSGVLEREPCGEDTSGIPPLPHTISEQLLPPCSSQLSVRSSEGGSGRGGSNHSDSPLHTVGLPLHNMQHQWCQQQPQRNSAPAFVVTSPPAFSPCPPSSCAPSSSSANLFVRRHKPGPQVCIDMLKCMANCVPGLGSKHVVFRLQHEFKVLLGYACGPALREAKGEGRNMDVSMRACNQAATRCFIVTAMSNQLPESMPARCLWAHSMPAKVLGTKVNADRGFCSLLCYWYPLNPASALS